jgi:hypothetical protein
MAPNLMRSFRGFIVKRVEEGLRLHVDLPVRFMIP